jgi:hypothetical protein
MRRGGITEAGPLAEDGQEDKKLGLAGSMCRTIRRLQVCKRHEMRRWAAAMYGTRQFLLTAVSYSWTVTVYWRDGSDESHLCFHAESLEENCLPEGVHFCS